MFSYDIRFWLTTFNRYAVCGPMEVIHLNAEGLKKYCETYGDTIYNVSTDFKGIPEAWKMDSPEGVAEVYIFLLWINAK